MKELIYEKRYPPVDIKAVMKATADITPPQAFLPVPHEIMQLFEYRKAESFVQAAVRASNQYQLDLEVVRTDEGVTVSYTLESGKCPEPLKAVMDMSDRVLFFVQNDYRLNLVLEFDTHYTIAGETT